LVRRLKKSHIWLQVIALEPHQHILVLSLLSRESEKLISVLFWRKLRNRAFRGKFTALELPDPCVALALKIAPLESGHKG
jgi:hypothetical protein